MAVVEVRTYTCSPEGFVRFLQLCSETVALRKQVLPGFRAYFTCDSGGVLNRVVHIYEFESVAERARQYCLHR